jgi:hypothetical protein
MGDPMSKITKAKRTRGMAQVVEWLSSKYMALSSNLSAEKKKKRKKRKEKRMTKIYHELLIYKFKLYKFTGLCIKVHK